MSYTYQWQRGTAPAPGTAWANITGGTLSSYTLTVTEDTKLVRVRASDGTTTVTSDPVGPVTVAPSSGSTAVYWGARIDGAFYQTNYAASSSDAPWSGNIVGGGWDLFEAHAGKKVTAIHWGGPGSTLPTSFDTTANQRCRDRGAFSAYSVGASTSQMTDLAANSNANGVLTLVDTWAAAVDATGYPLLARFCWEMNGNWGYPWQTAAGISSTTYKAAFSTWAARVKAASNNISIAWCPNVTYGVTDPTPWFPSVAYGAGNLDWLFMDGYAKSSTTYTSPATIFDTTVSTFGTLAGPLPIGIWETGCEAPTGSPGKAAWVTAFFAWLAANTDVKAVFWFNETGSPVRPHIEVGDSSSTLGGAAMSAFATAISDARYTANIVTPTTFPSGSTVPVP